MGSTCCSCSCYCCCCQAKVENELKSEVISTSILQTQASSKKIERHSPDLNDLPQKRSSDSSKVPNMASKQIKSGEGPNNDSVKQGSKEEIFSKVSNRNKNFADFESPEVFNGEIKTDLNSDQPEKFEFIADLRSGVEGQSFNNELNYLKNKESLRNDLILVSPLDNDSILGNQEYVCPETHSFKWKQDLVYSFMKRKQIESGPVIIKCFDCQSFFSRPGFECTVCFIAICQQCGNNRNMLKPVLLCSRNDELSWSVDSWAFTLETTKASRPVIVCSICRKLFQEPAYTCRQCLYFSCISCSNKKGFSPPVDLLKCSEGDSLSLNPSPESFFKCNKCSKETKEAGYFCKSCPFALCKTCGLKTTLEMVRHPGISCFHGHKTMGLSQVQDLKADDNSHCIACLAFGMKYVLLCNYCQQRLCLKCADRLQIAIEEFVGRGVANGKWIKWYRFVDVVEGEKKSCVKCEKVVNVGFYFYDNLDQNSCYCFECIKSSN